MSNDSPAPPMLPKPRVMWADYDPSYPSAVRFVTYGTKADQRGERPDLTGFPVAVIPCKTRAQAERIAKAFENA